MAYDVHLKMLCSDVFVYVIQEAKVNRLDYRQNAIEAMSFIRVEKWINSFNVDMGNASQIEYNFSRHDVFCLEFCLNLFYP